MEISNSFRRETPRQAASLPPHLAETLISDNGDRTKLGTCNLGKPTACTLLQLGWVASWPLKRTEGMSPQCARDAISAILSIDPRHNKTLGGYVN